VNLLCPLILASEEYILCTAFVDFLCFEGRVFTIKFVCSDPENIFLTDGASKGVAQVLNALIRDEKDGVSFEKFELCQ